MLFKIKKNSKKILKKSGEIVEKTNNMKELFSEMTDEKLLLKNSELKNSFNETKIPEAMALFREISFRTVGLYPYDVQLMAAYSLYSGSVSEMKTGEGKTLVALIASYISYLQNQKVHIVTVNNYLANRDAIFAKSVFDFIGVNIGFSPDSGLDNHQKSRIYEDSDIIYASNSVLGFDYLRSNIVKNWNDKIIKNMENCFAIVDEVDSVLIDEAKNPLIISGEAEKVEPDLINAILDLSKKLDGKIINRDNDNRSTLQKITEQYENPNGGYDYIADRKMKTVNLTEKGYKKIENMLIKFGMIESYEELYKHKNNYIHIIEICLSALNVYINGVDYIVGTDEKNNPVIKLIDQGTGRIMAGRVLSNGLHQAIEVKENIDISTESITLAEITYQNLFKLYGKVSGMTGTAYEDKEEFKDIYGLTVCRVPTRLPIIRKDNNDVFFPDKKKKLEHCILKIIEVHEKGQPILVGTNSVNDSEKIAELLKEKNINYEVLNAKNHERESEIIANAGAYGSITIATSMAGRGTDIILGGSLDKILLQNDNLSKEDVYSLYEDEKNRVKDLGGLFVLGYERNKSRRVDDQLKGRSGRQGDPGESIFFVSLEDDLMQMYGDSKRISFVRDLMFSNGNDFISGFKTLSNVIHKSQIKASDYDFTARLSLLKYDNVVDIQRRKFYSLRDEIMLMHIGHIDISNGYFVSPLISSMEYEIKNKVGEISERFERESYGNNHYNVFDTFKKEIQSILSINISKEKYSKNNNGDISMGEAFFNTVVEEINRRKDLITNFVFYSSLKDEKINTLDKMWLDILDNSSEIKRGIHLRGYAQKKPEEEYKKETWHSFNNNILNSSTIESIKKVFEKNSNLL